MNFFSWGQKSKKTTSFSFDNGTVRFVSLFKTKQGIQVADYGSKVLGENVLSKNNQVIDEALFVREIKKIIQLLDPKQKNLEAVMVIPDERATMFHVTIPKNAESPVGITITDFLKEYCIENKLLTLDDYICEYDIVLETSISYDVHVTLVAKKYAQHMVRLFKQAGCTILHIETAHHAVAKSCMNIPQGKGSILISFGKKETTIAIMHANHLVSQEKVFVGQKNLEQVTMKYLRVDQSYAEKIIDRHGTMGTHPDTGLLGELYLALDPIIQSIDKQLVTLGTIPLKTFGYRFKVEKMFVYGEGVHVKGIVSLLAESLRIPAVELDVWAGRESERMPILNMHAQEVSMYAESLSLALLYIS